jgi:hypothetical protein
MFAFSSPIIARMGLDVGGYNDRPDWPKMGPSLLIASCLILAIRTAKWPPNADPALSSSDMNCEIEFAIQTANRVFMTLITKYESIFPQKKEPWYRANEEDSRA